MDCLRSSFTATEIRCQEKSKGGLSYEVILAEPSVATPALKLSGPAATAAPKPTSTEEIEKKLKEAEDRRLVSWMSNSSYVYDDHHHNIKLFAGARGKDPTGLDGEGGQDWGGVAEKGRVQLVVHQLDQGAARDEDGDSG